MLDEQVRDWVYSLRRFLSSGAKDSRQQAAKETAAIDRYFWAGSDSAYCQALEWLDIFTPKEWNTPIPIVPNPQIGGDDLE